MVLTRRIRFLINTFTLADHLFSSYNLYVWLRRNIIKRHRMLVALCAWRVKNVPQRTPRPQKHPDWIGWLPLGWQQTSNCVQSLTALSRSSYEQRAQGRDNYLELNVFQGWKLVKGSLSLYWRTLHVTVPFHTYFRFPPFWPSVFNRLLTDVRWWKTLLCSCWRHYIKILTFVYVNHRRSLSPFLFRNCWTTTVWSLAQLYINTSSGYGNSGCSWSESPSGLSENNNTAW